MAKYSGANVTVHRIPRKATTGGQKSEVAMLYRCLAVVKYELTKSRKLQRGTEPKLACAERAKRAIDCYMVDVAELDEELVDATIYDLDLREKTCERLELAGFLYVRALVKFTAETVKREAGLKDQEIELIRDRLAEIGDFMVGDPIPPNAMRDVDRLLDR